MLDTADRQEDDVAQMRVGRPKGRLNSLRRQMRELQAMEQAVQDAPDTRSHLPIPMRCHGNERQRHGMSVTMCRRQSTQSTI